jgi:hypothetical protein
MAKGKTNYAPYGIGIAMLIVGLILGGMFLGADVSSYEDSVTEMNASLMTAESGLASLQSSYDALDASTVSSEVYDSLNSDYVNLSLDYDTLNADYSSRGLELSSALTSLDAPFYFDDEYYLDIAEEEADDLDEYDGVNFKASEIDVKDWNDARYTFEFDRDGELIVTIAGFEVRFDDGDDRYDVDYELVLEFDEDGDLDEADLIEVI